MEPRARYELQNALEHINVEERVFKLTLEVIVRASQYFVFGVSR